MHATDLVKLYVEEKRKDVTVVVENKYAIGGHYLFGILEVTLNKPKRVFEIRSASTQLFSHCGTIDLHHPKSLDVLVHIINCHMEGDCVACPFKPHDEIIAMKKLNTTDLISILKSRQNQYNGHVKYVLSFREHRESQRKTRKKMK